MKVKVCGMSEIGNILELVKLPVDLMGFIFYSASPRAADPEDRELVRLIRQLDVETVGVFVDENPVVIERIATRLNLDVIQLHGKESPEYCGEFKTKYKIIKMISVGTDGALPDLAAYIGNVDWFLFDTRSNVPGGSGQKFNWDLLTTYRLPVPFLLSGGIGPGDEPMLRQIGVPQFLGIDVNSRFEIKPGLKDIHLLHTFIENIKWND